MRLKSPINQIKKVSHPKLWLQSLRLPELAVSPRCVTGRSRTLVSSLSQSESWVLVAAVKGRALVLVPRHGGEPEVPVPVRGASLSLAGPVLGAQPAQATV